MGLWQSFRNDMEDGSQRADLATIEKENINNLLCLILVHKFLIEYWKRMEGMLCLVL